MAPSSAAERFKCTTMSDHDQPVAAICGLGVHRGGAQSAVVGDTTEFVIGESGKLYLAAILDLFSRFVVGWAVSAINGRHLALKALQMALKRRCPDAGLLAPLRSGLAYASEDYQRVLDAHGITCSMSRRGDCYDNAVMEAFFSSLKSELADRFPSCGEAKMELFDYRLDERSMCGWLVKFKRQKQTFHKYFHDGVGGPPESLRQAIAYRDEQIQRLPTPSKIWVTPPKEKGGTRGVTRTIAATPSGHVAESWVAQWVEVDAELGRRSFSMHKYGEKRPRRWLLPRGRRRSRAS